MSSMWQLCSCINEIQNQNIMENSAMAGDLWLRGSEFKSDFSDFFSHLDILNTWILLFKTMESHVSWQFTNVSIVSPILNNKIQVFKISRWEKQSEKSDLNSEPLNHQSEAFVSETPLLVKFTNLYKKRFKKTRMFPVMSMMWTARELSWSQNCNTTSSFDRARNRQPAVMTFIAHNFDERSL